MRKLQWLRYKQICTWCPHDCFAASEVGEIPHRTLWACGVSLTNIKSTEGFGKRRAERVI
jgi:hypothetical protein